MLQWNVGGPSNGDWEHINVLELKAGKFAIMAFTKMFPEVKVAYLQMDNVVALSYIKKMEGVGYPQKVLSGLFKQIWDYLIINGITIIVESQCGCPFSVPISCRLKGMESKPQKIQNNLQGSRVSQYRSLCIKDVTSVTNVHIMETRSIHQWVGCLPTIKEIPEKLLLFLS